LLHAEGGQTLGFYDMVLPSFSEAEFTKIIARHLHPGCPDIIQESDILFSPKKIASRNGQPGYGNPLRCKSCWRLASSGTRSGKGRLLQALTSDSTARIDGGCYRGHRLQQLVRSPETLYRIFLKENKNRLWNILEPLK
jgi:hypothetical protein